jgi:hypothetical protein
MRKPFKIILLGLILLLSTCSTQEPPKEPLVWVPGWKETASLAEVRVGAAVVEANGYIYMIGGVNDKKFLKTIEYAKIQQDGSLVPWKYGPSLNEQRAWMEAVVHDGYIYVVGGANSPHERDVYASNFLASVERARIRPDGTLSPWETEENSMVVPRRCNKVALWNSHIYAIGGFSGVMLDSIDRAEIHGDGVVGKWVVDPEKMMEARYVNGVKVKNGGLYVFGGHEKVRGAGLTTVEWSKISDTGELGPWKHTSPLQVERYGLGTASHGDYFYALGGITGMEYLDSIEKARIEPYGKLSPWEFTSALSTPRINYSVVVYKDWIYVISGKNSTGYLISVEYAMFNDKGDIGFFGSLEEKEAFKEAAAKREEAKRRAKAEKEKLSFEGVVVKILQAEGYSYIQVSIKDQVSPDGKVIVKGGVVWLAAPNIKLDINNRIRFSKGLYMPNFYSKELQYKFKGLFFVEGVQPVK